MMRSRRPFLPPAMLAAAALGLAGCGGSAGQQAGPGTPEHPLVAVTPDAVAVGGTAGVSPRSNEAASGGSSARRSSGAGGAGATATAPAAKQKRPSFTEIIRGQSRHPRSRFTPCNLVTEAQAHAILGAPVQQPVEAPQGPTCIYRTRSGKGFVTVAVQQASLAAIKQRMRRRVPLAIAGRKGYCGTYGQPMLYLRATGGKLLSIGAPCPVAKRFAAKAIRQITA